MLNIKLVPLILGISGVVQEQRNIESAKVMRSVAKRFSEDLDLLDNK